MFGFLNPETRSEEYRALYCNTCRHIRSNYGVMATPFVNYEAVLIHALACDAKQISLEASASHCKIVPFPKKANDTSEAHKKVGEFSSALAHLFLKIKIEDDIHDDNSWRAKGLRKFYGKNFTKSLEYFSALDADFASKIETLIASHSQIEGSKECVSLEEYAQPTARAFAYVFGLLGVALNDVTNKDVYARIGESVGNAMIYTDCAFDWKKDKKKGLYNPVRTLDESADAIAASQAALRDGVEAARQAFGENCVTEQILLGVHDRLYRRTERDKRYEKYLVPLRECSSESDAAKSHAGIIMASNAACPSLGLFAAALCEQDCDGNTQPTDMGWCCVAVGFVSCVAIGIAGLVGSSGKSDPQKGLPSAPPTTDHRHHHGKNDGSSQGIAPLVQESTTAVDEDIKTQEQEDKVPITGDQNDEQKPDGTSTGFVMLIVVLVLLGIGGLIGWEFLNTCPTCNGSGAVSCSTCGGDGVWGILPCLRCDIVGSVRCSQCDGTGKR